MRGASTTEYVIIIAVALVIGVIAASLLGVFPVGAKENAGSVDRATGTPFGVVENKKIEGALKTQVVLQNNGAATRRIRGIVAEDNGNKYTTTYDPNVVFDAGSRATLDVNVPDSLDGSQYSYGLQILYDDGSQQDTNMEGNTQGGDGFGVGRICTQSAECAPGLICIFSSSDNTQRCRAIAGFCASNEECASLYCEPLSNMCTDRPSGDCNPICMAGSPTTVCSESLEWCGTGWSSSHSSCAVSSSCNGEYGPCLNTCGGPVCKNVGGGCIFGYECCSGVCDNYACSCKNGGEQCGSSSECCSGLSCNGGACTSCKADGQSCSGFDSDCCQAPGKQNCNFIINGNNGAGDWTCMACRDSGESCDPAAPGGVRECCDGLSCNGGVCGEAPGPCAQNGQSCDSMPCCQVPDTQTCETINGSKICALACGSAGDQCGLEGLPGCCPTLACVDTPIGSQCYPLNFVCKNEGEVCNSDSDCCTGQDLTCTEKDVNGVPTKLCAKPCASKEGDTCRTNGAECCSPLECRSDTSMQYSCQNPLPVCNGANQGCTEDKDCCQSPDAQRCLFSESAGKNVCTPCSTEGKECFNPMSGGLTCCSGLSCKDGACVVPSCVPKGEKCNANSDCCQSPDAQACVGGYCAICVDAGKSCGPADTCCGGNVCVADPSGTGMSCQMPACLDVGKECSYGTQCCSGNCQSALCCFGTGKDCNANSDCCSGRCDSTASGPQCLACLADGSKECDENSDCCSGLCDAGTCATITSCRDEGQVCDKDNVCCAGLDCKATAIPEISRCAKTPACGSLGQSCSSDSDCCQSPDAMVCKINSVGPSGSTGACALKNACVADGGVCASGMQCCSGNCNSLFGQCQAGACKLNSQACAYGSQCCSGKCPGGWCLGRLNGESCTSGTQCDSGYCDAAKLQCANVPACVTDGGLCSVDSQCCSGNCNELLSQCEAVPACRANGKVCNSANECCSGYCDESKFQCADAPACLKAGDVCSATSDCCQSPEAQVCAFSESAGKSICQVCGAEGKGCGLVGAPCCGGLSCVSGACTAAITCGAKGEKCNANSDCCQSPDAQACVGGYCAICVDAGKSCGPADTCCGGGACVPNPSGPGMVCKAAALCMDEGQICDKDNVCCAGLDCKATAIPEISRCAKTPVCGTLGKACAIDSDCCQSPDAQVCKINGAGPTGPTGVCALKSTCVSQVGATCMTNGKQCCSPLVCQSDMSMQYSCQNPPICTPVGGACASDSQCCSNNCNELVGQCLAAPSCKANGAACTAGSECCSTYCDAAKQQCANAPACVADGGFCTKDDDCCSANCNELVSSCAAACVARGSACTADSQCCQSGGEQVCYSFRCNLCPTLGQSCRPDAEPCCGGNVCNGAVCVAPPACYANGKICSKDADCCSSYCDPAKLQCANPPACGTDGKACLVDSDCCTTPSELTCQADVCRQCIPAGKNCRPDIGGCCSGLACNGATCQSCKSLGNGCGVDSDCCSGICYGNVCASCRQVGYCATDSDCCSGNCDELSTQCINVCRNKGEGCAMSTDCCTGLTCQANMCEPAVCSANGKACSNNAECCSSYCDATKSQCANAPACVAVGGFCNANSQCCSNYCNMMMNQCANAPACVPRGSSCAANPVCCTSTDYCDPSSRLCAACKIDGKACGTNAECCTGICNSLTRACGATPITLCRNMGESCTLTSDCCSGRGLLCLGNTCRLSTLAG